MSSASDPWFWVWILTIGAIFVIVLLYVYRNKVRNELHPSGRDRRIHKRVNPANGAPILVQIIGENFIERLKAIDISIGGLGIKVPHMFKGCKVDAEVDLVITLPGERPFQAKASIRHTKTNQDGSPSASFGVQFTGISEEKQMLIGEYVEKLTKN
jgi:hypothetical protein